MSVSIKLLVLQGTLDKDNPLALLRANPLVWSKVFDKVNEFYNSHILRTENAFKSMNNFRFYNIEFPSPENININMMPIKADYYSIPSFLRHYSFIICNCARFCESDQTIYLTIHESLVEPQNTQRRQGVHIERPGNIKFGGSLLQKEPENEEYVKKCKWLAWGLGFWNGDIPKDGIFMASSVSNSCQIWPIQIQNPQEITDKHGGIECMRHCLGQPYKLQKNELVWFTDTTPHESLPIESDQPVYRQFFRLVIGRISVWYSKHNTPNPLGILPDAPISDEDKFENIS